MAELSDFGSGKNRDTEKEARKKRFRELAASLRGVARTIASSQDRAALESAALSYERLADGGSDHAPSVFSDSQERLDRSANT